MKFLVLALLWCMDGWSKTPIPFSRLEWSPPSGVAFSEKTKMMSDQSGSVTILFSEMPMSLSTVIRSFSAEKFKAKEMKFLKKESRSFGSQKGWVYEVEDQKKPRLKWIVAIGDIETSLVTFEFLKTLSAERVIELRKSLETLEIQSAFLKESQP